MIDGQLPDDLRTLVEGAISPGVVVSGAGWDFNRESWWFRLTHAGRWYEVRLSLEEWEDRRFDLIALRAKLAAPSPEATLRGHRFDVALVNAMPGDRSKHEFVVGRRGDEAPRVLDVEFTEPAKLVLQDFGRRKRRDERAYVLCVAMNVVKDRVDTGGPDNAHPIGTDSVSSLVEGRSAMDSQIRDYVGRKLHQAYQSSGPGVGLQFDWTDLEYLGVTEEAFMRAVSLRDRKDWAVVGMKLVPADEFIEGLDTQEAQTVARDFDRREPHATRDVFLSHASEDKPGLARPLADALSSAGLSVWFDEYELVLGDSLRRRIEEGLRVSRHGLVILSHSFFRREWPQKELDGLFALETDTKRILPVWSGLTIEEIRRYSPVLADRVGISAHRGIPAIVHAVTAAVKQGLLSERKVTAHQTGAEDEILRLAAQANGEIYKLYSEQNGHWLRVGRRDLHDVEDPLFARRAVEALDRLVEKGLARHSSGLLYVLTIAGLDAAKEAG